MCFQHFFHPLCVPKRPLFKAFGVFRGPKRMARGSKWAKNTCLSSLTSPGSFAPKRVIYNFLIFLWTQRGPFPMHFGILHRPKCITTGSKRAENTCVIIPWGLRTTLEKRFSPRGPWWTNRWPTRCAGRATLWLHQVTSGTGVQPSPWAILRVGNHEKWGVAGGLGALGIRF